MSMGIGKNNLTEGGAGEPHLPFSQGDHMPKLTKKQAEEKFKNEVLEGCPICGETKNNVSYGDPLFEGAYIRFNCDCNDCGADWEEFYKWAGLIVG